MLGELKLRLAACSSTLSKNITHEIVAIHLLVAVGINTMVQLSLNFKDGHETNLHNNVSSELSHLKSTILLFNVFQKVLTLE